MATNYAQKLERERQSPKGNMTKKENLGTDTGYMRANKRNEKIYGGIRKIGEKIQYYLGGREYGVRQNARIKENRIKK